MANFLSTEEQETVKRFLLNGQSLRWISRELSVHKNTVLRYRRLLLEAKETIKPCACGDRAGHRGWCQPLFLRSPARQAFMAAIERPAAKRGNALMSGAFFLGFLYQLEWEYAGQRPIQKCMEKACIFPRRESEVHCEHHRRFFFYAESMTDVSLDVQDLFNDADPQNTKLRVATKWEMENYERVIR